MKHSISQIDALPRIKNFVPKQEGMLSVLASAICAAAVIALVLMIATMYAPSATGTEQLSSESMTILVK